MTDAPEALVLDLLEWIGPDSRTYSDVIEAWHTSCPRFPVWEEANDRGFVERHDALVRVTSEGRAFLESRRPRTRWPDAPVQETDGDRARR